MSRGTSFQRSRLAVVAGTFVVAAAVLSSCLESGPQRKKQKQSMADLRRLAAELDAYKRKHGDYPSASSDGGLRRLTRGWLPAGHYKDPWGNALRYERPSGHGYAITSPQKDGKFEAISATAYPSSLTRYFDCDIVFIDGAFVRSPEGLER